MKTQQISIYAILLCALVSLTSAKPIKTNNKEAIIIGRILIDSQQELEADKISLRFINGTKGGKTSKANADGYFCTKIGKEGSFIDYIEYKNGGKYRKIFTDNCAIFYLSNAQTIYYIGDIQLQWTPSERDKIRQGFSIGVGMGGNHMGGAVDIPVQSSYKPEEGCPPLEIMEYTDAINWYKANYPDDDRAIETSLIEAF